MVKISGAVHHKFDHQRILDILYGRLTSEVAKERLYAKLSNDHRSLVVDRYASGNSGVNRIILKPAYVVGEGDTCDKVKITITPGVAGIKREDVAGFLEELLEDRVIQDSPEFSRIRENLFSLREMLKREHQKGSSDMICSVIGKDNDSNKLVDAIFKYMVLPCLWYANNMGRYSEPK